MAQRRQITHFASCSAHYLSEHRVRFPFLDIFLNLEVHHIGCEDCACLEKQILRILNGFCAHVNVIFCLVRSLKTSSRACRLRFLPSSSPASPSKASSSSSSTSSGVLGSHALSTPSECAEYISTLPALQAKEVILLLTFR